MANKTTLQLWVEADRWLRHWQQVGGIGRPDDWGPLDFDPRNYAAMASRVGQVGGTFAGTEQHGDMVKLLAAIRAPAAPHAMRAEEPAAASLEDRLRALAEKTGETFEEMVQFAKDFDPDAELAEEKVARLEKSWADHEAAIAERAAAKEPGASG